MSVQGKVVAITGTSSGIGRTVAEVFAERGALVVGCARRTDKGQALEEKIRAAGGQFSFVTTDVTKKEECDRFVDAVVEQHGRIDVLINNAGGSKGAVTDTLTEAGIVWSTAEQMGEFEVKGVKIAMLSYWHLRDRMERMYTYVPAKIA